MWITSHHSRLPPGPRGLGLWGALRRMQIDPIDAFEKDIGRYGPSVHYAFPLRSFTLITEPEHVYHILNANAKNYNKDTYSYRQLKDFVGDGLFTANGAIWEKYRPAFQRSLSDDNITGTGRQIEETVQEWMEDKAQNPKQIIDLCYEMTVLTLTVVCRVLLGFPISLKKAEKVARQVTVVLNHTNRRISNPFRPGYWLPTKRNTQYWVALRVLDKVVEEIRVRFNQGNLNQSPFIDGLARLASLPGSIPANELRDQFMTMLLAGHETTAKVLFWYFYTLASNPEQQSAIRENLMRKTPEHNVQPEKGNTHTLADSALMETLRLYPPLWLMERQALEKDEIGPYRIPAGSTVAIYCYHIQRRSDLWEKPDRFIAERFCDIQFSRYPRYAYFPFGGGARHCVGSPFARLELQLVTAHLLRNYRFTVENVQPIKPAAGLTLGTSRTVHLTLERI